MLELIFVIAGLRLILSSVKFILSLFIRLSQPGEATAKQDLSYEPTVSVLLPCYNEGKDVYGSIKTIVACDYPVDKFEVIATDDCSRDDSFAWIQKAAADFPGRVVARRNPHNIGKSRTLIGAAETSTSEIIIVIDSDCIFAKDTIRQLVSCFVDPGMGVVGGKVGVVNPNTNALTQVQTLVYYLAFDLWKTEENWTRSVTCVGGYLMAIRRCLFERIRPKIEARNWLGTDVIEGEDRFITHHALLLGYKTYINIKAQCWTKVPENYAQFFKQQYRWRKSGVRDFCLTFRLLREHFGKVHPNGIYNLTIVPLTQILCTIGLFLAPLFVPLFWLNPITPIVAIAVGAVLHFVISRKHPDQKIKTPLYFGLFGFWWVINSFYLTILSFLTLDFSDWGSRSINKAGSTKKSRVFIPASQT